ncbi:MAG: DoxX family protein [Patescibacteria group bacterium]
MKLVTSINNSDVLSADHAKLILRLAVGFLVLLHGIFKLQNPAALDFVGGAFVAFGLPSALAYLVFIGEIVAPLMLITGYQTKIAAGLLAINLVVAVILVHLSELFTISPEGGGHALELQLMFLAGTLAIFGLGAGKYRLFK